jgi:hypothetical protein
MIEWGTANILIHFDLLVRLIRDFSKELDFHYTVEWDDEDMFFHLVASPHLPEGYHGQQDVYIESGLKFKRDCDV